MLLLCNKLNEVLNLPRICVMVVSKSYPLRCDKCWQYAILVCQ